VAVLAVALIATACSTASTSAVPSTGSTSTSTSSTTSTVGPTSDNTACALITPADIATILHVVVGKPKATVKGSATTCLYPGANKIRSVIVEYSANTNAQAYEAARAGLDANGFTTTPVLGLGGQAYSSSVRTGGLVVNTVASLVGPLETVVIAARPLSQVEALMQKILDVLQAEASPTSTTSTTSTTAPS
jgi:hypothetical protein